MNYSNEEYQRFGLALERAGYTIEHQYADRDLHYSGPACVVPRERLMHAIAGLKAAGVPHVAMPLPLNRTTSLCKMLIVVATPEVRRAVEGKPQEEAYGR